MPRKLKTSVHDMQLCEQIAKHDPHYAAKTFTTYAYGYLPCNQVFARIDAFLLGESLRA